MSCTLLSRPLPSLSLFFLFTPSLLFPSLKHKPRLARELEVWWFFFSRAGEGVYIYLGSKQVREGVMEW